VADPKVPLRVAEPVTKPPTIIDWEDMLAVIVGVILLIERGSQELGGGAALFASPL